MADREGFEPSRPVKICTLSRGVVSATHPSVHIEAKIVAKNHNFKLKHIKTFLI